MKPFSLAKIFDGSVNGKKRLTYFMMVDTRYKLVIEKGKTSNTQYLYFEKK